MADHPISRVPDASITGLSRAIERLLGYDVDPVFPAPLVLLRAMRDAINDPAGLGIAGLTTTARGCCPQTATSPAGMTRPPVRCARSRPC
jgi:hypothetical protein